MSSIFSIFFVLFLWWFLTGIILYTAKRLDLGDSKTRFTVVLVTLPLFFCAWYFYFHCLDGMSYAEIFCSFMASLFIWGWVELTFPIVGHSNPSPQSQRLAALALRM